MKIGRLKNHQGFTLIELMVAVVIIAILAAVAYPSYRNQVLKTRRDDAKRALAELAQLQENYYVTNNKKYAETFTDLFKNQNSSIIEKNGAFFSEAEYYQITITSTGGGFTFRATPTNKDGQSEDSDCANFSINFLGHKDSTPKDTCW